MSEIGHNSAGDNSLRQFIERVERVEEAEKGVRDDKKDIFAEAKSQGYDTKIMRQIIRLRKMTNDDRIEMEAILETYKSAVGLSTL